MRVMVLFDLPVVTPENKRNYVRFRKFLIKSGFIMMQESVYTKLAPNPSVASAIVDNVRKNKPPEGLVQMMTITEKQYSKIEFVVGSGQKKILESDERLVII